MRKQLLLSIIIISSLLTITVNASPIQPTPKTNTPLITFTPGPDITLNLDIDGTVSAHQLLWTANTTGTNYEESAVTVADGIGYIGSCATHGQGHDTLYAVDITTGDILWSYPTGPDYVGPVIDDDTVYFGTCTHGYDPDNEYLYAFNRFTGDLLWSIPIYGGIAESIQMDDTNIYFGTGFYNCKIMAVNKQTGDIAWQYNTTDDVGPNKPMLDGNKLYVCFYNGGGNIYKIDTTTGQADWVVPTNGGPWDNSITTDSEGRLFMAIYYASTINCYDDTDGSLIWSKSLNGGSLSFNAYRNGRLYIADTAGYVYCYQATDGTKIWETNIGTCDISSPTLAGGLIFIGTREGSQGAYYALNETTGQVVWTYPIGASVTCPPSIANGTMFCGSDGWNMYAFDFGIGTTTDWRLHRFDSHNTAYSPGGLTEIQSVKASCSGEPDELTCILTNEYDHPIRNLTLHLPFKANWYDDSGTLLALNSSDCFFSQVEAKQDLTLLITQGFIDLNITITRPVNGIYFRDNYVKAYKVPLAIGKLTVEVEEKSNSTLDRVDFYLDGKLTYSTTSAPYTWLWTKLSFGTHTLGVVAHQGSVTANAELNVWKFF